MWKQILVAFLAINALFWGLFSHSDHCQAAALFTNSCAPHYVHVSFGVVCFLAAVVISQRKMFFK
jgi:hypothetical protein